MSGSELRAQLTLALGAAYIIDRELPGRGMSRVFVAHEERADRDVIIKVLSEELTRGLSKESWVKVMKRASKLDDPHTLPVLTARSIPTTGAFFYTTPFVPGESLRQRMQEAPLGFDESVAVLRDVARSLAYGHAQGLVHRNLKPEKVVLAKSGAVVTDFGVAMALEAAKPAPGGVTRGTPAYMPPEHILADPAADHRADIYSWGVMAYELFQHAHPFAPLTSHEELMEAQLSETPPMLMYKRFGVPEQLAQLVMRCLAKDPDDRPSSAMDLLTVLDRIPDKESTVALESARGVRWIGASILVALVLFVFSATAVWRMQKTEAVEPPRVAVLPFVLTGAQPDDSVYAEGMADEVSERLALLPSLLVIEQGSARSALAQARNPAGAGELLQSDFVVSTTMAWSRDASGAPRAQVTPSIVRVADAATTWEGEPVGVSLSTLAVAQDTIARRIIRALEVAVTPADSAALNSHRGTSDTAAFAAFTRGNSIYRRTRAGVVDSLALAMFERAYRLDPRYADAWAGAGAALSAMHAEGGRPQLADSVMALARKALAIDRTQPRALTTLARLALTQEHPEDAKNWIDRAVSTHPSDLEALELRPTISLLAGDSAATWRDVERLALIAPRSPDAFVVAATGARAIRRFRHAGRLLQRARLIDPERADLVLEVARLARADGDFPAMARAVRMYRMRGGVIAPADLTLLRVGDPSMQRELAGAAPETYGAKSASDSVYYYVNKATLFLALRRISRAKPLLDSSAVLLTRLFADTTLPGLERLRYANWLAWSDAARGERAKALLAMMEPYRAPYLRDWPGGQDAAFTACNGAEIYAFLDQVDQMIPLLRQCLTLPGGYATSAFVAEPALTRHARDPRVSQLLAELNLEIGHTEELRE